MSDPTATYLHDIRDIRATGANVKETSFYPALANLLNDVGKRLKPKVRCVINLANRGAGLPDGGLFTPDQFQRASESEPLPGQLPARGAIEIKGTGEDIHAIARSQQVTRYLAHYRLVLVTNYRDFVLVGRDDQGQTIILEEYRLAAGEKAFWESVRDPAKKAEEQGERFVEYLSRVMLHASPIAAPKDVAWFLASYARDARARIEAKARAAGGELAALANVRAALEQALGIKFEGEKGEHFFRSTLVQTLFYGVFSAWVLWSKRHPPAERSARFNWHEAAWSLHVPMIRALFEQVATPSRLGPLGLTEVLDWTEGVLNRVERATFFERFNEEHAVQYFYEPFLEAFDPVLRKELGVWYTPAEVVKYMVARVNAVLREELDIPDGLADPRVYVLDPCCGTGAYLVEVVRRIHETMSQGGADALIGDDLKHAAMERVFGFEILPAPFVVAHLQMGLLLQNLGARLDDERNERVGVYLTNALTGWEPPAGPKQRLMYPELEEEREAADGVKRETPILVILGNPPYNGFAGVAVAEERDLSDTYRTTKRAPAPQGQGLNDLYVRFFRMADWRIVDRSGLGIIAFISNYSWLDGRSFTGMRERYLEAFDSVTVDCLNGDKFKTGKLTPDGRPDPSIFSTEWNREGIQVGTAITLLVRKADHRSQARVRLRQLWGREKHQCLLAQAENADRVAYTDHEPILSLGFPFSSMDSAETYILWPLLAELIPVGFPGVQTKQDSLLIDISKECLINRMQAYFNPAVSDDVLARLYPGAMDGSNACEPRSTRQYLSRRGFLPEYVVPFVYRAFDRRWIYWEPETNLLGRKSPDFFPQVFPGNVFLEARQRESGAAFTRGMIVAALADNFGNGFSNFFPKLLKRAPDSLALDARESGPHPNLTHGAETYLRTIGIDAEDPEQAGSLFHHIVATVHTSAYRRENASALRLDWPRIPLPASYERLVHSAELGERVSVLLDTETAVREVTSNPIRRELESLGLVSRAGGGSLSADDLALAAGWGHPGKGGITMPGKGRVVEREYAPEEVEAIRKGVQGLGLSLDEALGLLGRGTFDVYINDMAYWRNIPVRVWAFTIGGYQVIKKWLSYRERSLLGRALTPAEAREVRDMVRRVAALILLQHELDANYAAVKASLFDWSTVSSGPGPRVELGSR